MNLDLYNLAQVHIYEIPDFQDTENWNTLRFHLVKDAYGKAWLYAVNSISPASHIYVTDSDKWDKAGEGFGGSTIKLILDNEEEFRLNGGWHTNSDSLFAHTGIDLRDQHLTITHLWSETGDILYEELKWACGQYDRTDEILKRLGLENKKVFCAYRSSEGSSFGWRNYNV